MKNKIFVIAIISLFAIQLISADVIMPGYHTIPVTNTITNINDFQNYIFVSGNSLENGGPGIGMCPLQLVESNGNIKGAYKFCDLSVFAIEKSKWDEAETDKFMFNSLETASMEEYFVFMNSIGAKEVIKNINVHTEVPDSSTVTEENNYYTIDLQKVKIEPDKVNKGFNYWNLWPLLLSLIALILIIIILIKRKK